MINEETIKIIAAEESHHVCESGAPNAKQHNARVVEQAIGRAIAEVRDLNERQLRLAWETGFNLCRSYGDNWARFDGEEKEKRWRMTLPGLIRNSKCKCP